MNDDVEMVVDQPNISVDNSVDAEADGTQGWTRARGAVQRTDGRICIGRVGAPPQHEATSGQFAFWVPEDVLVEDTQLVTCESRVAGRQFTYYALIESVRRRSRERSITDGPTEADGDLTYQPPFNTEGCTYAVASVLRIEPPVLTPPRERSDVLLAGAVEAGIAYGFDEMSRPLAVGRLRNGGSNFAGSAQIDLAYLLGDNGGHLNVTGMAGAGTKSSFLLVMLKMLLNEARPNTGRDPLYVVPIILNVKGEELMWIDRPNREFEEKRDTYAKDWAALGVEPKPFANAEFYAPTVPGTNNAPMIDGCNATAYTWSLADVLRGDLFPFLFSNDDITPVMMALVYDIVALFTRNDGTQLQMRSDVPAQTWNELLQWIRSQAGSKEEDRDIKLHQTGTWRAVYRRLWDMLAEGESIFPRDARSGAPLRVTRSTTSPPQVIDIHRLPPSLQRFVVAAILKQVVAARTGANIVRGLRYLIMLDELNRFAPRGSTDEITKLLERVASEMRSQGIILLGAQQLASQVSVKVVEMAAIRVLGRTGPAELQDRVWQSWNKAAREQASALEGSEKLIMQPTFRQPMFVKIPFPAWAMRREDIATTTTWDQTAEV